TSWMHRWPTPADLAAEAAAEAIRAWARLGYPRRALRLHACAVIIASEHKNQVPSDLDALLSLPGIGAYTARAVAAFAFGQRQPVVDVNVRRVLARAHSGLADAGPATTTADMSLMAELLPSAPHRARKFCAATMELGAVICRAKQPECGRCPIADHCAWRSAGAPTQPGVKKRVQRYLGTDRYVRGRLLAILRDGPGRVSEAELETAWHLTEQRERALKSLLQDGLVCSDFPGSYSLP
ncbi:MAG: A/G-specific adenine glycosylase, partial [Pseudonocardiaceae bacterium]